MDILILVAIGAILALGLYKHYTKQVVAKRERLGLQALVIVSTVFIFSPGAAAQGLGADLALRKSDADETMTMAGLHIEPATSRSRSRPEFYAITQGANAGVDYAWNTPLPPHQKVSVTISLA